MLRHRDEVLVKLGVALDERRHERHRGVQAHRQVVYPVERPDPEILEVKAVLLEPELLLDLPSGRVVHHHRDHVLLGPYLAVREQSHRLAAVAEVAVDREVGSAVEQPDLQVRHLRRVSLPLVNHGYDDLALLALALVDQAHLPSLDRDLPILRHPDHEELPMVPDEIYDLVVVVAPVEDEDAFAFLQVRAYELEAVERVLVDGLEAGLGLRMEHVEHGHGVLRGRGQRRDAADAVAVLNRALRRRRVPHLPHRLEALAVDLDDVGVVHREHLQAVLRHERDGEGEQPFAEGQVMVAVEEPRQPLDGLLGERPLVERMGDVAQDDALPFKDAVDDVRVELPYRLPERSDYLAQMVKEKPIEPVDELVKIAHVGHLAFFVAFGFLFVHQKSTTRKRRPAPYAHISG